MKLTRKDIPYFCCAFILVYIFSVGFVYCAEGLLGFFVHIARNSLPVLLGCAFILTCLFYLDRK